MQFCLKKKKRNHATNGSNNSPVISAYTVEMQLLSGNICFVFYTETTAVQSPCLRSFMHSDRERQCCGQKLCSGDIFARSLLPKREMIIESFYNLLYLVFTIDYLLWHQTRVKENTSSARLLLSSRGVSVAAVATDVKLHFFRKCMSNQILSNQFFSYSPKSLLH